MPSNQMKKFKKLYSKPDSTHYVSLGADGCTGVDLGYLDSQRAVEAAVLHYAHINSVKTVRVAFSRNIMADADLVLEFSVGIIIGLRDNV